MNGNSALLARSLEVNLYATAWLWAGLGVFISQGRLLVAVPWLGDGEKAGP